MKHNIRNIHIHKWVIRISVVIFLTLIISGIVLYYNNRVVCRNCNIILVSIDTLSALHLPCYGYKRNTAPNLCRFAKENTQFINAYSQAPMTLPSHFSMFTSLYPHEHNMTDGHGTIPLDEKNITLAQVLKKGGYRTVFNGPVADSHLPLNLGIERGFDVIEERSRGLTDIENWEKSLKRIRSDEKEHRPTFLFLHTYAVHDPYIVKNGQKRMFTDVAPFPNIASNYDEYYRFSKEFFIFCAAITEQKSKRGWPYHTEDKIKTIKMAEAVDRMEKSIEIFDALPQIMQLDCYRDWYISQVDQENPDQRQYLKALYDEEIYDMDQQLADLFSFIESNNLRRNTIVIITADHGEEFWQHGIWGHSNNVYETSVRVPFIISTPKHLSKKFDHIVEVIDIYPTILRMVGLSPSSIISGMDLTGIMYGSKVPLVKNYRISEWQNVTGFTQDDWSIYSAGKKPLYLFNLGSDPFELKSILNENTSLADDLLKRTMGVYNK